jgi:hypothetical protein
VPVKPWAFLEWTSGTNSSCSVQSQATMHRGHEGVGRTSRAVVDGFSDRGAEAGRVAPGAGSEV